MLKNKSNYSARSYYFDDFSSIHSFSIEDDGEGFTQKNIEAFSTLWTDNKRQIGCKGSGRFTWLSVFNIIQVDSFWRIKISIST